MSNLNSSSNRRLYRKRLFWSPAMRKAEQDRLAFDADSSRPIRNDQILSLVLNHDIVAFISGLRTQVCPAHVHRPSVNNTLLAFAARVVAVVVDTIHGIGRTRGLPQIGEEHLERGRISGTRFYAPAAVLEVVRITATALHTTPGVVLFGRRHTMPVVTETVTPATSRCSTQKAIQIHCFSSTAFASAEGAASMSRIVVIRSKLLHDYPFAELIAFQIRQIKTVVSRFVTIVFSHGVTSLKVASRLGLVGRDNALPTCFQFSTEGGY